jgi:hypothetical protein
MEPFIREAKVACDNAANGRNAMRTILSVAAAAARGRCGNVDCGACAKHEH